jgi:hypothetical protein
MPPEKLNPASLGDGRVQNRFNCLQALNGFENTHSLPKIQARRVAWLARRFAVSATIAATLAPHCFGEAK